MKQHITKEQWDEIDDIQKDNFWDEYNGAREIKRGHTIDYLDLTIGEMIEFLGYDIDDVVFHSPMGWTIIIINEEFYDEELCNALWKAVKYKMKKEISI